MKTPIAILVADHDLDSKISHDSIESLFKNFFSVSQYKPYFYRIVDNEWPDFNQFEYHLITGSKYSALDHSRWMAQLEEWVRSKRYKKLIGICFGHQFIAKALGGTVEHGDWHVGVYPIHLVKNMPRQTYQSPLSVRFNHHDHVKTLPDGAKELYTSTQCHYASFMIKRQILCMQFHPEFTETYHTALLEHIKENLPEGVYDKALTVIQKPTNHDIILNQVISFLNH